MGAGAAPWRRQAMAYSEIIYDKQDKVAIVTLNRPDRMNAITPTLAGELKHAMGDAEHDPALSAIVVTGAGKSFCPGMDMGVLQAAAERKKGDDAAAVQSPYQIDINHHSLFGFMLHMHKPIIGALNGNCVGMGLSMALHFDIRVAGEGTRMSAIFVRRGLSVEHGSSWLLPRLVGISHAMDLALTGRIISAQEALAMGLVSRVVPDAQLLSSAIEMAREIAANCSPTAMAEAKRMLWQHLDSSYQSATDDSTAIMFGMFKQGDFKEGVLAFVKKRPPNFKPV
jgi:enoyl-CoA hydratase/carnithine racemase